MLLNILKLFVIIICNISLALASYYQETNVEKKFLQANNESDNIKKICLPKQESNKYNNTDRLFRELPYTIIYYIISLLPNEDIEAIKFLLEFIDLELIDAKELIDKYLDYISLKPVSVFNDIKSEHNVKQLNKAYEETCNQIKLLKKCVRKGRKKEIELLLSNCFGPLKKYETINKNINNTQAANLNLKINKHLNCLEDLEKICEHSKIINCIESQLCLMLTCGSYFVLLFHIFSKDIEIISAESINMGSWSNSKCCFLNFINSNPKITIYIILTLVSMVNSALSSSQSDYTNINEKFLKKYKSKLLSYKQLICNLLVQQI